MVRCRFVSFLVGESCCWSANSLSDEGEGCQGAMPGGGLAIFTDPLEKLPFAGIIYGTPVVSGALT